MKLRYEPTEETHFLDTDHRGDLRLGQRVRYQPGPGPEVPLMQDHRPRQTVSPVGVAWLAGYVSQLT